MAVVELASAYITIVPSMAGAGRQIASELAGVDTSAAGASIGEGLSSAVGRSLDFQTVGTKLQEVGSSITDLGGQLTKYVTVPLGSAAAAAGGLVATLGWGRLTSLDAAQAQLRGLGYEAEDVARISEQVEEAVTGGMATMGEGTAVAAGALAAGVAEGEELVKYIELVDAAAVGAQRPISDMATVFNRVQGMGTLMTGELNMIEDGLPGFTAAMAEASGVTIGEFREMVTAGEVTSEQFLDVMDDFAGGMAEAYADSWDGLVGNTKAWVGIIGETILEGVFQESKEELANFQEWLKSDDVQAWAEDFGVTVGEAFSDLIAGIKGVIEWWGNLDPGMQDFLLKLVGVAIAAGPVLMIFGKMTTGIGRIVTTLGTVSRFMGPVIGGLGKLGPLLGGLKLGMLGKSLLFIVGPLALIAGGIMLFNSLGGDMSGVMDTIRDAISGFVERLPEMISGFVELVPGIIEAIVSALPELLEAGSTILESIIEGIVTALPLLVEGALQLITGLTTAILQNLPAIINAAVTLLTMLIDALIQALPMIITAVVSLISTLVEGIVTMLPMIIQAGIDLLMALIQGIIQMLPQLIEAAITLITSILEAILENLPLIIDAGVELLIALITGIIDMLPQLIDAAITLITELVQGLLDNLPQLIEAGIELIIALIEGLITAIPDIIAAIPQIISAIWDAVMETDWLQLGIDIIQGVIDGIMSMAGALWDGLTGLIGDAWDGLMGWLGIASPSKRARDEIGMPISQGVAVGIEDAAKDVELEAVRMAQMASNAASTTATFHAGVASDVMSSDLAASGGRIGPMVHMEVHGGPGIDPEEVAEAAFQKINTRGRGS